MSTTELERFNAFLGSNEAVRKQAGTLRGNAAALAEFAVQHGFSLGRTDFEVMSDEELDGVTGGSGYPLVHGDTTVGGF